MLNTWLWAFILCPLSSAVTTTATSCSTVTSGTYNSTTIITIDDQGKTVQPNGSTPTSIFASNGTDRITSLGTVVVKHTTVVTRTVTSHPALHGDLVTNGGQTGVARIKDLVAVDPISALRGTTLSPTESITIAINKSRMVLAPNAQVVTKSKTYSLNAVGPSFFIDGTAKPLTPIARNLPGDPAATTVPLVNIDWIDIALPAGQAVTICSNTWSLAPNSVSMFLNGTPNPAVHPIDASGVVQRTTVVTGGIANVAAQILAYCESTPSPDPPAQPQQPTGGVAIPTGSDQQTTVVATTTARKPNETGGNASTDIHIPPTTILATQIPVPTTQPDQTAVQHGIPVEGGQQTASAPSGGTTDLDKTNGIATTGPSIPPTGGPSTGPSTLPTGPQDTIVNNGGGQGTQGAPTKPTAQLTGGQSTGPSGLPAGSQNTIGTNGAGQDTQGVPARPNTLPNTQPATQPSTQPMLPPNGPTTTIPNPVTLGQGGNGQTNVGTNGTGTSPTVPAGTTRPTTGVIGLGNNGQTAVGGTAPGSTVLGSPTTTALIPGGTSPGSNGQGTAAGTGVTTGSPTTTDPGSGGTGLGSNGPANVAGTGPQQNGTGSPKTTTTLLAQPPTTLPTNLAGGATGGQTSSPGAAGSSRNTTLTGPTTTTRTRPLTGSNGLGDKTLPAGSTATTAIGTFVVVVPGQSPGASPATTTRTRPVSGGGDPGEKTLGSIVSGSLIAAVSIVGPGNPTTTTRTQETGNGSTVTTIPDMSPPNLSSPPLPTVPNVPGGTGQPTIGANGGGTTAIVTAQPGFGIPVATSSQFTNSMPSGQPPPDATLRPIIPLNTFNPVSWKTDNWNKDLAKASITCKDNKWPCTVTPPPLFFDRPGTFTYMGQATRICTEIGGVVYEMDHTVTLPPSVMSSINFSPFTMNRPTGDAASKFDGGSYDPAIRWEYPVCNLVMPVGAQLCPRPKFPPSGTGICGSGIKMSCPGMQCCGPDGRCGDASTACGTGCQRDHGKCWPDGRSSFLANSSVWNKASTSAACPAALIAAITLSPPIPPPIIVGGNIQSIQGGLPNPIINIPCCNKPPGPGPGPPGPGPPGGLDLSLIGNLIKFPPGLFQLPKICIPIPIFHTCKKEHKDDDDKKDDDDDDGDDDVDVDLGQPKPTGTIDQPKLTKPTGMTQTTTSAGRSCEASQTKTVDDLTKHCTIITKFVTVSMTITSSSKDTSCTSTATSTRKGCDINPTTTTKYDECAITSSAFDVTFLCTESIAVTGGHTTTVTPCTKTMSSTITGCGIKGTTTSTIESACPTGGAVDPDDLQGDDGNMPDSCPMVGNSNVSVDDDQGSDDDASCPIGLTQDDDMDEEGEAVSCPLVGNFTLSPLADQGDNAQNGTCPLLDKNGRISPLDEQSDEPEAPSCSFSGNVTISPDDDQGQDGLPETVSACPVANMTIVPIADETTSTTTSTTSTTSTSRPPPVLTRTTRTTSQCPHCPVGTDKTTTQPVITKPPFTKTFGGAAKCDCSVSGIKGVGSCRPTTALVAGDAIPFATQSTKTYCSCEGKKSIDAVPVCGINVCPSDVPTNPEPVSCPKDKCDWPTNMALGACDRVTATVQSKGKPLYYTSCTCWDQGDDATITVLEACGTRVCPNEPALVPKITLHTGVDTRPCRVSIQHQTWYDKCKLVLTGAAPDTCACNAVGEATQTNFIQPFTECETPLCPNSVYTHVAPDLPIHCSTTQPGLYRPEYGRCLIKSAGPSSWSCECIGSTNRPLRAAPATLCDTLVCPNADHESGWTALKTTPTKAPSTQAASTQAPAEWAHPEKRVVNVGVPAITASPGSPPPSFPTPTVVIRRRP